MKKQQYAMKINGLQLVVGGVQDKWVEGIVDGVAFSAKVYDADSERGINGGHVSKLWINETCNYSRGWEVEPSGKGVELYNAVMSAIEVVASA